MWGLFWSCEGVFMGDVVLELVIDEVLGWVGGLRGVRGLRLVSWWPWRCWCWLYGLNVGVGFGYVVVSRWWFSNLVLLFYLCGDVLLVHSVFYDSGVLVPGEVLFQVSLSEYDSFDRLREFVLCL